MGKHACLLLLMEDIRYARMLSVNAVIEYVSQSILI
jgi:hypothetical protein